jgi:hypothetical protein
MGIEIQMTGNSGSAEHRRTGRYRLRGEATARVLDSDLTMPGRILDLSTHGCLFATPCLVPIEIDSLLDMSISTSAVAFRAIGSVRHCLSNHERIGVSFVNLTRRGESELLQLIEVLKGAEQSGRTGTHEVAVIERIERPPYLRFSLLN